MRGVNRVVLIGNLGRAPEIHHLDGNIAVAKFPLATTETYKDKNGHVTAQTEWHNIVLWRGLAELAGKYLQKGSLVYIEGKIKTRHWEDKEKVKRSATEILCDNMVMLDKRKDHNEMPAKETHINSTEPLPDISFDNENLAEDPRDDLSF